MQDIVQLNWEHSRVHKYSLMYLEHNTESHSFLHLKIQTAEKLHKNTLKYKNWSTVTHSQYSSSNFSKAQHSLLVKSTITTTVTGYINSRAVG